MSYPEPRYRGDGEASAIVRPSDTVAEVQSPNGNRVRYLATGASTGGLFGLYRFEMGPEPSGPGPHFHRTMTESFYVLDGAVRIYDGRTWVEYRVGDWVHVPMGGVHGFRNESGAPASILIHFAPGADRESYFEGLARFARDGYPDEAELAVFYAAHDNHWVR